MDLWGKVDQMFWCDPSPQTPLPQGERGFFRLCEGMVGGPGTDSGDRWEAA